MTPPLVSYLTFNRMGLTARNIESVLKSTDDFELHIIDNNSKDDTWELIKSLDDPRIKSRIRFPVNVGPIYAVNFNLQKRRPDQYFIALDSDVYLHTPDWITRFTQVFEAFPDLGLLGVPRAYPYNNYMPPVISMENNGVSYLQLRDGKLGVPLDFVSGHCQCLRPGLIDIIGHWCEENGYGDAELSVRVCNYTPFKAGFTKNIMIDMVQSVSCEQCTCKHLCKLDRTVETCFAVRNSLYKNELFAETFKWKYLECFKELQQGKRAVYCASIHNKESIASHTYNMEWAQENFNFYLTNAN